MGPETKREDQAGLIHRFKTQERRMLGKIQYIPINETTLTPQQIRVRRRLLGDVVSEVTGNFQDYQGMFEVSAEEAEGRFAELFELFQLGTQITSSRRPAIKTIDRIEPLLPLLHQGLSHNEMVTKDPNLKKKILSSRYATLVDFLSLAWKAREESEAHFIKPPSKGIFAARTEKNRLVSVKSTIKAISAGERIVWSDIPADVVRGIIEKISEEVEIPASMFTRREFLIKLNTLGGNSINTLYEYVRSAKGKNKKPSIDFLLEQTGITATTDDTIHALRMDRIVSWERVRDEVKREILEKAAKEIGIPSFILSQKDLLTTHFEFLDGRTLSSIYKLAQKEKGRVSKETLLFFLEKVGIKVTFDDVVAGMQQSKRFIRWELIPPETVRELLHHAAMERDIPASMMSAKHLERGRLDFLMGKNLRGLIEYTIVKHGVTEKQAVNLLLEDAGISATVEDVITTLKKDERVYWNRVPPSVTLSLLGLAANDIGIPVSMLGPRDLFKKPLEFLDGKTLGKLYWDAYFDQERKGKPPVSFIYEKLGIKPSTDDVIAVIKSERMIFWDRVPSEVIVDLFNRASEETGIPVSLLGTRDLLYRNFSFLGGKSLRRLYEHAVRRERAIEDTALGSLRKSVGLPDATSNRRGFRGKEIFRLFAEYFQNPKGEVLQVNHLLPWISKVSEIYTDTFHGIEKEEIHNELYIFLAQSLLNQDRDIDQVISSSHLFVERYVSGLMSKKYKEKSLASPLGDTNVTLADMLEDKDEARAANQKVVFSRKINQALESLSAIQKALVIGITINDYTFDEMVNEVSRDFGLETNSDVLQEYYEDALLTLRQQVQPDE